MNKIQIYTNILYKKLIVYPIIEIVLIYLKIQIWREQNEL